MMLTRIWELVCCIFSDNDNTAGLLQVDKENLVQFTREQEDELWKLYFDGSSCKEGVGAGVLLISLGGETVKLMYKLEFVTTNNTAEYEALLLGLKATKDLAYSRFLYMVTPS